MTKRQPSPAVRVVGIGASAGGLDALKQLLANVPTDTGMAFVIMQHLAASQTGVLRTALASSTTMPITDIVTGIRLKADHVHVVPPQVDVVLLHGALVLRAAKPGGRTLLPIDAMLRSFAEDEASIGVVLSGNANDGSEGLRALRARGGLTFVQDPATAQFDEMPRNAIAAGAATFVLTPAEIGAELGRLAGQRATKSSHTTRIIQLLRDAIGVDFTEYKRPTIERRIAHRMQETKHSSSVDYAAFLEATPSEAATLAEDLLIHVTQFFREPATLDVLVSTVFPQIVASLPVGDAIRVWIPGCSTGQEAYSLAILLTEFLEAGKHRRQIQIFGTDLSEQSIETARAGRYADAITKQVSAQRLERFFTRSDAGFRISKAIRDSCVFVRHDVTCDPPFAKIDLVSCRNLLIYLGTSLQQGVIPMIHYALNQPGFLVLGRAESVVGFDTLFSPVEAGVPIFARLPTAGRASLRFAIGRTSQPHALQSRVRSTVEIQRDVDHVLLARYSPACVLVDANGDIRQYRGRTGPFLEPAPGLPHHNIYKMARGGVGTEIRTALGRAQREDRAIRCEHVPVREDGHTRHIDIEVLPLLGVEPHRHCIVVFEESKSTVRKSKSGKRASATVKPFDLAHELAATKEYLQSTLAQHATANEELGLANEELQSINEELHSTNEELQTAKEELQSANEELVTVNDELRSGNERLEVLNSDLVNVLAAIDVAVIILDREHQVRRFTPRACSIINFIPSDIGRRIGDLHATVALGDLDGAITRVIESLIPYETEVREPGDNGCCYRLQIRPYRTEANRIDGVVLAFVDITALRRSVEEARVTRDYAEAVVETVPSPLVVLDIDQRIRSANRAFCEKVGATNVIGRSLLEITPGRWLAGGPDLEQALATRDSFDDIVVERETLGDTRVLAIGARVFSEGPPLDRLLLVAMLDITDRIRAERERARADQLELGVVEHAAREKESFLNAVSHELRTPLNAILLWTNLLRHGPVDDKQHRLAVETIEHSARAEARLVDDLLDLALSRRPANGLAIEIEQIDPAPVVEAALDAVRADALERRIAIDAVLASNLRVSADPRRLQQIAWNLATNAIKFTPDGGRISVSLSGMRDRVELRVTDNGKGITPELIPRVFDAFWQADQSSTRNHQGLGIGLALVRHLVERQGGTIRVESDGEGAGATFAVQLPTASV